MINYYLSIIKKCYRSIGLKKHQKEIIVFKLNNIIEEIEILDFLNNDFKQDNKLMESELTSKSNYIDVDYLNVGSRYVSR